MLSLRHIVIEKGSATLLDSVSVDVCAGEVVAIVGPNGAGKTTLLRTLTGEETPAYGSVTLDGFDVSSFPSEDLALRRAVLPQESTLSFGFSALDVVLLGRTPHHTGQAADLEVAARAMEEASVMHLAARPYPTLSGGEKQRVHLARVLAQLDGQPDGKTQYLLLDEPTSALDLSHQQAVLSAARSRAESGMGVIAVLHDLNLAAQYADRLIVLREGRVLAEGRPSEILNAELVQAAFDVPVVVMPHPCLSCPLVVHLPDGAELPSGDGQLGSLAAPISDIPDLTIPPN